VRYDGICLLSVERSLYVVVKRKHIAGETASYGKSRQPRTGRHQEAYTGGDGPEGMREE